MNAKKIFSILLVLVGEFLIIISFIYFGNNLSSEILTLDIVVSSVIYSLFFIDVLFPMIDFNDKSQKVIGSMGIRWFTSLLYKLSALGVMIAFMLTKPVDFDSQIIIQGILFFLLLLGFFSAVSSSGKVEDTYVKEKQILNRVEDMKKAMKEVQIKLDLIKNTPAEILSEVLILQEDILYISPCNNQDAYELETNLLIELKAVKDCLFEFPLNSEKIIEKIQNCQRICIARKGIYSI